jgi:hypothetical protein
MVIRPVKRMKKRLIEGTERRIGKKTRGRKRGKTWMAMAGRMSRLLERMERRIIAMSKLKRGGEKRGPSMMKILPQAATWLRMLMALEDGSSMGSRA